MKKSFTLLFIVNCVFAVNSQEWVNWSTESVTVPMPAKYESFEDGIPKTWKLQGSGKLSINPWHYKLGKKSLQWDFAPGDVIKINNTIGYPYRRGLMNNACFACFGIWVYSKKMMPGEKLRFEFCTDGKKNAYFDFDLNFVGWQLGTVRYGASKNYLNGKVSDKINNILIRGPKDIEGQVLIDLVVYNGPRYSMFMNILPNKKPWKAPGINVKKYPVPQEIAMVDLRAVERIKKILLTEIKITPTGSLAGTESYEKAMKVFNFYNIHEDVHGIRGRPINLGRDHFNGEPEFLLYCDIPPENIIGFRSGLAKTKTRNSILIRIFNEMAKGFSKGITQDQYDKYSAASVKLWKFLIDQGFNTSYGYGSYYTGTYEITLKEIYSSRDALSKAGLLNELFNYAQYSKYPLFSSNNSNISMDYFANVKTLFYLVFLYSNDIKKQIQALRYLSARLRDEIIKDHGSPGFKPDGSGIHGMCFTVDYFKNGLYGISKVVYAISHSSFSLSDAAYDRLKTCALNMYFYSNNMDIPIFMQGTSVLSNVWSRAKAGYKVRYLHEILRLLALAGKNGCDKELAQAYVNLKESMKCPLCVCYGKYDPIFEEKYGIKPGNLPAGNISMPYGLLVAHRRADWVAVSSGSKIDMRQRGNQYMYHGGNGPLSILGKDGFHASGNAEYGWDWNRTNGTTCLYMPKLHTIKFSYSHKSTKTNQHIAKLTLHGVPYGTREHPKIKRGNGGISWRNCNGCFRMKFRGDRFYNDFGAIKTYFFINDRIYALGSNIHSDNQKYHVQTNLYQKALYKLKKVGPKYTDADYERVKFPHKATGVDGREITGFPVVDEKLKKDKAHYLIDPVGNGYFIPAGQDVFVARKNQKSRTSNNWKHFDHEGDFATAWLDHGIACKDAKYAYVVFPYCNTKEFAKFSSKDFEILRQDEFAHILHDKIDNFYAGIFFKGGDVTKLPYVKNVERDCQIMYKMDKNKLEIAAGDPDTHQHWTDKLRRGQYGGKSQLEPFKITFAGNWKLEKPVDGVKIISYDNAKTIIEFASIHGKDFNFTLERSN